MDRYSNFIANYPYHVICATSTLTSILLFVSLFAGKAPDFSDPQLGFETRGTVISMRLTAWNNLIAASKPSGPLVINPAEYEINLPKTTLPPPNVIASPRPAHLKSGRKMAVPRKYNEVGLSDSDIGRVASWVPDNYTNQKHGATDRLAETLEKEDWSSLRRSVTLHDHEDESDEKEVGHNEGEDHNHLHISSDGFFCEGPSLGYSHVVVTSRKKNTLFTLESLLAICNIQDRLLAGENSQKLCVTIKGNKCCPPWSLSHYVAMLRNRSSCSDLTEDDVAGTLSLLDECQPYFINGQLGPFCSGKCEAPLHCLKHDTVYNIFHYITDVNFEPGNSSLHSTMIFLPFGYSASLLPYYKSIAKELQKSDDITAIAADFGAKGELFDDCLRRDILLLIGGIITILLCLWSYTDSLFLTISTNLAIAMTFVIAYFIYTFVFGIDFFPFMNLLGIVIAIGIGADDAFILCKIWRCVKEERNDASTDIVLAAALRASILSMSGTSLTTALALLSSCVSSITAIKCYSIFAGTAVIVNYCLMLSWLPACIVILEDDCFPHLIPYQWRPFINNKLRTARRFNRLVMSNVERWLVQSILVPKWLWVFSLGALAIAASVIVLHYPKLRLPDSKNFQVFESKHPFELYDSVYKNMFWFERLGEYDGDTKMPLRFIWGVLPLDNGDFMDPASRGSLEYDPQFNVIAKESQEWLLRFCQELRHQPFYQPTLGPLLSNCFIESFKSWMSRRCKDSIQNKNLSPCCESSRFPFSQRVFTQCITQATAQLHKTPSDLFIPGVAGPKFARGKRGEIKAIVIEFDSNYTYSNSFDEMDLFYSSVESWFQAKLQTAPPGLRNGWFISDLGFYDVQMALSQGTIQAIILSIIVAFLAVFITTLNVLLSLFASLTISAIIFVTVAILVLLGWKLNVLESIAVTTAIGLSVDFSLHYGLHYLLAEDDHRLLAAAYALKRMSGPTAMGALTTGAAGAFMLASSVLPYIKIGILVVVLMAVSWLYSTYFLIPLLAVAGPERGCGQFSRPSPASWFRGPPEAEPPVPMWSESTLSTSSGPAEIHELDALTKGQRRCRRPRAQSPALPEDLDLEGGGPSPS